MHRYAAIILSFFLLTHCTMATPRLADEAYGGEDKDWGIPPAQDIRKNNLHAPTPTTIPGGTVLTTYQLQTRLANNDKPVVINVVGGKTIDQIPGSVWLNGAGLGSDFDDLTQERLRKHLDKPTAGNPQRTLIFYCLSAECWLSYNAALRAIRLGYTHVSWYRGGSEAWKAARLPVVSSSDNQW